MFRCHRNWAAMAILLVGIAAMSEVAAQQAPVAPAEVSDCVISVSTSPDATISVDGREFASQREFRFPCEPQRRYRSEVLVKFPDGQTASRTVFVEAGRRHSLSVRDPRATAVAPVVQSGHSTMVSAVALSNDGRYVATASPDRLAILWDHVSGCRLQHFQHADAVETVDFSPNGQQLLTATYHEIAVWDVHTGRQVWKQPTESTDFNSIGFSPDGKNVVAGGPGNSVRILSSKTGALQKSLIGHSKAVCVASYSTDGKLLATGARDGEVRILDLESDKLIRSFHIDKYPVTGLIFTPDGHHLLTAEGNTPDMPLWDVSTGRKVRTFRRVSSQARAAFHPNGKQLLLCSSSRDQRNAVGEFGLLFDVESGQLLRRFGGLDAGVEDVVFSVDGNSFAIASRDRTASIWNANSGDRMRLLKGQASVVSSMALNADNSLLATGGFDEAASLWNLEIGQLARRFENHGGFVDSVAFDNSGRFLLSGSTTSDEFGQTVIGQLQSLGVGGAYSQAGSESSRLWDLSSGKQIRSFQGRYGTFSPDGQFVFTGDRGGKTCALWRTNSGQKVRSIPHAMADAVGYSPDGYRIATGGGWNNKTAVIWDSRSGRKLVTLNGHKKGVNAIVFTPSGSKVLTASIDGTAILWDVSTGQKRVQFEGHSSRVTDVAFSPDASRLLTSSTDGTAILWHVSGKKLRTFTGHSASVEAVAFSSDGRRALTASFDGTTRIWDVDTGEELLWLLSLGNDWLVVTPEGLFDGSGGGRNSVSFRVGDGLNVVPVDRFFQDFYYPGLLAAIWRGERPLPAVELGEQLPPLLAIDTQQSPGNSEDNRVSITVTATDKGGGIKGPWIRHNGARLVGSVQTTERIEGGVRRTFRVDLIEGRNTLEVVAASADGSFESEPATLVVQHNQPLPKSQLHVLVVGIDDYDSPSLAMQYAVSDASRIAEVFKERGGSLYETVNVKSLLNKAATAEGIAAAIRKLSDGVRAQDTVVVFLAGHGVMLDEQFCFLPSDFHTDGETLQAAIRERGLMASVLGEQLAEVPALKRMIIFDTGQSGKQLQLAQGSRDPFAFRGAVERLSRAQGAFTIAASASSNDTTEVAELRHGVLSYSFLAGLKAVDAGPLVDQWVQPSRSDKVAEALELFTFTSSQARRLGRKYFGQEQNVQYSSAGVTFPVLPVVANGRSLIVDTNQGNVPVTAAETQRSGTDTTGDATLSGATLHVIAVGINEYADSSLNLQFAAPDAMAVAALLKDQQSSVFQNVSVRTLTNSAATRQGIRDALNAVSDAAKPDDTVAVFLAGHGVLLGQRYYFIPADFEIDAAAVADAIRDRALPADELGDALARVKATQRLLVFDTCASGGAINLNKQGDDPFAFRGAIEQLGQAGGTFTLAAVGANERAQEVSELGHGILTYCLLAAAGVVDDGPLSTRPMDVAGSDRKADVLEWFSYAAGNAPRLTKQYFGRDQQVQIGGKGKAFPVLQVR